MERPGDGDGIDGRRFFPEHPSPILHAPRDNIFRKDNPSLRYRVLLEIPPRIKRPPIYQHVALDSFKKSRERTQATTRLCFDFRTKHRRTYPFIVEPFSKQCLGQNEGLPEIFKTSSSHFKSIPCQQYSFVCPAYLLFVLHFFNILKSVIHNVLCVRTFVCSLVTGV